MSTTKFINKLNYSENVHYIDAARSLSVDDCTGHFINTSSNVLDAQTNKKDVEDRFMNMNDYDHGALSTGEDNCLANESYSLNRKNSKSMTSHGGVLLDPEILKDEATQALTIAILVF